jgi:hypothetical protein
MAGAQWFYWALWSAVFAALTAIFAKLGLEGVDSDLATLSARPSSSSSWPGSWLRLASGATR